MFSVYNCQNGLIIHNSFAHIINFSFLCLCEAECTNIILDYYMLKKHARKKKFADCTTEWLSVSKVIDLTKFMTGFDL